MTDTDILHLGAQALSIAAELAAPILIGALAVGVIVSLFQTVFGIQDQTLAMVPKLVIGAGVIVAAGGWMLHALISYTTDLYGQIPSLS